MENEIVSFFLIFSHDTVLLPLIVLGFIWLDRSLFYHATSLLLLAMLYNYLLKISFRIPQMPHLGPGFGFPSGHMLMSTAFYGWLAYKTKNWPIRVLLLIILLGVGYALEHFEYHYYSDVFGGVFAAVLLIIFYRWGMRLSPTGMPMLIVVLATAFLGYEYYIDGKILSRMWLAYYALVGYVLSGTITRTAHKSTKIDQHIGQKVLATLICAGGMFLIRYGYKAMMAKHPHLPGYITETQWFGIGFLIPFSVWFSHWLSKRITTTRG